MKARLAILGLVLPLLLAAQKDPPETELKEFTVKEGGFKVLLPGDPKEQTTTHKSADGKDVTNHIYVIDKTTTAYVVAYLIDPNLAKGGAEAANKALENARKGVETNLKGKLLEEKKITLDKHPGLEFQMELALGIYRSRIYIVNDRLYQVTVLGPKDVAQSKQSTTILESFKLTK